MELELAANRLEALGNPTRLKLFRLLVQAGRKGLPVGHLQRELGIPASTLSHHVARLVRAGVVLQQRQGSTLHCHADYDAMNNLVDFLNENCCQGQHGPLRHAEVVAEISEGQTAQAGLSGNKSGGATP